MIFFEYALCSPSSDTLSFQEKWKMLRLCTYRASFGNISHLQFSSPKFWNVFLPAETLLLGGPWVVFWPVMISRMMHQIDYGFYWSIKTWSKFGQKSFTVYSLKFKVYSFDPSCGPMHLWKTKNTVKNQNFCENYILRNIK